MSVAFAIELYGEIARTEGNVVFSPTSVRLALGLAYAGARGATAEQMRAVLGELDDTRAQLERWDALAHPPLPEGYDPSEPFWVSELARRSTRLVIANRLWTQRGASVLADYLAIVERDYRADAATLDFAHDAEAARATINAWVSDQTDQHIEELVPPRVLTADTHAVLTNAVYFEASWDDEFLARFTAPGPFWLSPMQSVDVPLMRGSAHRASASTADADLVELPYGDGKMSMVLVVPKAKDGLPVIERGLDALPAWLAALKHEGVVDLTMPKFTMAAPTQLAHALKQLGMQLPFTFPGADFSGIDGTRLLYLSQVVHQATLEVNEQGTVATAATGLTMRAGGRFQEPKVVRADRPFLFLVRDRETNAILFMGRFVKP